MADIIKHESRLTYEQKQQFDIKSPDVYSLKLVEV